MGLLDDLKKQADIVTTQKISQQSLREGNLKQVEEKMTQSFQYLNELLKHLAVVKPVNPVAYSLPGIGDLKNLGFAESFIDYRRKRVNDRDYFDFINLFIKWGSGETLLIERDMPAAAEKVRDALFAYHLKFQEEEEKGQRGTTATWRFTVQASIVTDVNIRAEHDHGGLIITVKNAERLGTETFAVPAAEVKEPLLEEFAKMLLGQPVGGFRKYRTVGVPR